MRLDHVFVHLNAIASKAAIQARFRRSIKIAQTNRNQERKLKAHAKALRRKECAKICSFAFLCEPLAALRLCVKVFAFSAKI